MAYAPYEFLWIIKESAYGTAMTSPTAGTDSIYIRLAGANRFTPRPVPGYVTIPFGGGFAKEGYRKADKYAVAGNLQLELCYSQAQLLLDWAITRINSAQTSPWTTTEQIGDLASCTVYHGVMRDDGTIKRRRYKGVKAHDWKLSFSAQSSALMLTLGLQAQKWDGNAIDSSSDPDSTAFPAPADTDFPTDLALFQHTSTHVSIGSTLSYLESLELTGKNDMAGHYYASHFLSFDRLRGREATATCGVLYTATPDWRAALEGLTNETSSFAMTNGSNTITIDFKGKNLVTQVNDDLRLGDVYNQTFTLTNQWDPSSSADVVFTYA